jgi:endogenous inhibitor of DNA gyrase (YacG/DUF329 family)
MMEAGEVRRFPCPGCGADLNFDPKAQALECPYCAFRQTMPQTAEEVDEQSFDAYLGGEHSTRAKLGATEVRCDACGAISACEHLARACPFCGATQVTSIDVTELIAPEAVLPFTIEKARALAAVQKWLRSLWFAPSELKRAATHDGIRGVYVPHWTWDAHTRTFYTGQRGEHYYVTDTYTTRVNGKSVSRTRRVRKTRWYPASGRVERWFDDVLVPAIDHLPKNELADLEPWDLGALAPYDASYLAGYEAAHYQVDLKQGFDRAKEAMGPRIHSDCCRDIGGDEQRVTSKSTSYSAVTFKHVLLPVWVAAYRYRAKVYRVLVNARSGEVKGERPWSKWKIFGVILLVIAIIVGIIVLVQMNATPTQGR